MSCLPRQTRITVMNIIVTREVHMSACATQHTFSHDYIFSTYTGDSLFALFTVMMIKRSYVSFFSTRCLLCVYFKNLRRPFGIIIICIFNGFQDYVFIIISSNELCTLVLLMMIFQIIIMIISMMIKAHYLFWLSWIEIVWFLVTLENWLECTYNLSTSTCVF